MTPNVESTDTVETADTNDNVQENSADYVDIYTSNDAATRILKSMYVISPLRQNLIS